MYQHSDDFKRGRAEGKSLIWKWGLALVGVLLVSSVAFGLLRYARIIGTTVVERVVFEQSFQYKEANKARANLMNAQISELEAQLLNPNLEDSIRPNIEAQLSVLRVKLNSTKRQQ